MLLYLRNESLYRIDTIELIDGCYPRITYDVGSFSGINEGVRSPPPTEEYSVLDLNIEPALWGIILILDKVCVDIRRRRFSWATASVGKILDDEGPEDPSYRTHCADDALYAYDDNIDELFKLAEHLIDISHSRTQSIRESEEEQSCLIRMLYCCILPKVQIYQKDLDRVDEAIKKQMTYIRKIDNGIERDSQVLDDLYKVLCKQQDERLHQFKHIASERKCTKKFVTVLNTDLNKRKLQLLDQIDANQTIVQRIKGDIQDNGETDEKKTQLEKARGRTASLHMILQGILMATVDTIKEALESEGFPLQDEEKFVLEYLQSKEMSENQKKSTRHQMEKKIRATSILENLKRIKEEITQVEGVASATTTSTSGVRPTDVINDSYVPEYQTLSERVAAIVSNPDHPSGVQFAKFTRHVRDYCHGILEQAGGVSRGNSAKQKKNLIPNLDNGYLLVDDDGSLQEEYLTPLDKLCEEINQHCDDMAELFLEQFNSNSDVFKYKLRLCYEENFYGEVGEDIMKVYKIAYKKNKEKLIRDLQVLSKYPINCLDLGMKDEWWLQLFEKRRVARQRSSSTPIPRGSRFGTGNNANSDYCSPDSEAYFTPSSSSSRSSGSEKGTHESTNTHLSTHESTNNHRGTHESTNNHRGSKVSSKEQKRSTGSSRSSFISFIKRISREISDEGNLSEEERISRHRNDSCYDNYDDKVFQEANKISAAIETRIPNGTSNNNNKITASVGERLGKASLNDNDPPTAQSSGENGLHREEDTGSEVPQYEEELSTFAKYFGPSLDCLKDVFVVSSVFEKLKCLTKSLTKVTDAVQELRRQVLERDDDENNFSLAITADDLLPLMVLIMLQMDSADAASIVIELKMMQDLIPKFLSIGCYGWALVEFDMASQVLQSLCTQFDTSKLLGTSA